MISELMIDPADVFDSRGEWVELSNVGDQPANLEGWTFTDERREHVVLPDLSIEPGQFVVVTRTADPFVNGGAEPDWVYGNEIVLYNPSDRLILSDVDGVEQDRVDWYPGSGLTVPNGRSLARRPSTMHPGAAAQWCASTTIMVRGDLGSPGAANNCDGSATPLVISEVMQNPQRSSDDTGEFFEVHNPGTTAIDMAGWTVKDDDDDRFTIASSTVVPAGGYAVLGTSGTDNGRAPLDYVYGDAMRLFNDTDELVIADTAGILVDRVAWDDGQTFPDPDGASMSLLDPAADNAVGSNWCTSTTPWAGGDLGTPGSDTWCGPVADQTIVVTEIMFDPELPPHERASEWFEVTNVGTTPVDLAGWTLTAGEWKVHTIGALVVEPGTFAVLAASADPVENGSVEADDVYGGDLPLFNRTGRIIVRDAVGAIVDRVDWSAADGFPLPSGHSIELGDPTSDNALGANWCVSSSRWADGDFGTPGSMGDCEAPPASPALRIVEIMRNPFVVRDSVGEWLEIENPTDHDVDLDGWALGDDDSDHHVIRDAVVVPANGSIVLGRSTDPSLNGGAPVAYSYGDAIVLGNRADEIVLADPHGRTVDAVRWDSGSEWIRPNGASMALLDGAWCVSGPQFGSGDLGTPDAPNDCTELAHDDVVISEVHIDPAAVSDTIGEWIELTNASASPIDIEGWKLRDDDADRHTIRTGAPWVIAPGESVVLGRERSSSLNGGAPVDYEYGTDFPITNRADEIVLVDDAGVWVDRVAWASGRRLPASSGVSASLRSLDADNALPANW
ncbi:MAG: lamin tail domain-containing protein, partial [Ilumatobacteraceae bacterium]